MMGEKSATIETYQAAKSSKNTGKSKGRRRGVTLGIVGLRASGKTTYLAMLYELLQKEDNPIGVAVVPSPDAQDYLDRMRARIRAGESVPPNPADRDEHIPLRIVRRQRVVTIDTMDYAGEIVRPREQARIREWFCQHRHDGVLVFLPAESLADQDAEDETVNAIQTLFHDLAEAKQPTRFVAVVVTKADKLDPGQWPPEKIEAKVRERFGRAVRQVEARTNREGYRAFLTSALGNEYKFTQPATPQEPRPYGVVEPFSWLIKTVQRERRKRRLLRAVILSTCMLAVIIVAGLWLRSRCSSLLMQVRSCQHHCQELTAPAGSLHSLRATRDWYSALAHYSSWLNLWPQDHAFVTKSRQLLDVRAIQNAQAVIESLDKEDDLQKVTAGCQDAVQLLKWHSSSASRLTGWLEQRKVRDRLQQFLGELKTMSEDSEPRIEGKIKRAQAFLAEHPSMKSHLQGEIARLEIVLIDRKVSTDFESLKAEVGRQSDPWRKYDILTRSLRRPVWTNEQREQIAEWVDLYRAQAAASEWEEICRFDALFSEKWAERIKRRKTFKDKFTEEARKRKVEAGIHDLYEAWDLSDYSRIRNSFRSDPVNGIDGVVRLCSVYRDSGRPVKRFGRHVDAFLAWRETLDKQAAYTVLFDRVAAPPSPLTDQNTGVKVQVELRVGASKAESIIKTTDGDGFAYGLGRGTVKWKYGDKLTVKLTCFEYIDEHTETTLEGKATLAFLAGEQWIDFEQYKGTKVLLKTDGSLGWFVFPAPTERK